MKILLLTRYGPLGASSRYRSYQFLPYLRENGFEIHVEPLLDDWYLEQLYKGSRRSIIKTLTAYANRVVSLLNSGRFDLVWIEKEALPWIPSLIESKLSKTPYIVDYDDALFHRYDVHKSPIVRTILGNKISDIMRRASLVISGNPYIAEKALLAGALSVEILPTVVDIDRYPTSSVPNNMNFTIGWIGSPSTTRYLELVRPALKLFCERVDARFVAVGASPLDWPDVPVAVQPWSEENEVTQIQSFDVGIMPLVDSPWERGKCGLKLIQYMACSRPTIGTPVGLNSVLIDHGVTGLQAHGVDSWLNAFDTLHKDLTLRHRMGEAGRKVVESNYQLRVVAPRLAKLLRGVL